MNIAILYEEKKIANPGNSISSEYVIRAELCPDRNWFKLFPGMYQEHIEEAQGEEILIAGIEYIINYRRYPLKGYGIKCLLTEDYSLIPILRKAKGREIKICQNLGYEPEESYWPIIEFLPVAEETTIENNDSNEIVEKALSSSTVDEHYDESDHEEDSGISEPDSSIV